MWDEQMAKLYEKKKYVIESASINYDDCIKYIIICFSFSFFKASLLKNLLLQTESNKVCSIANYNIKRLASICNYAKNRIGREITCMKQSAYNK